MSSLQQHLPLEVHNTALLRRLQRPHNRLVVLLCRLVVEQHTKGHLPLAVDLLAESNDVLLECLTLLAQPISHISQLVAIPGRCGYSHLFSRL